MTKSNNNHTLVFGSGPQVVYGYTLDSYEGVIKIGHTTSGDYVKRIRDQNTTGMPGRPVVRFAYFTENSQAVEAAVHRRFAQYRLPGKEWFRLTTEQVLEGFEEFAVAIRGKAEVARQKAEAERLQREQQAQRDEERREAELRRQREIAVEIERRLQEQARQDQEEHPQRMAALKPLADKQVREWLRGGGPPRLRRGLCFAVTAALPLLLLVAAGSPSPEDLGLAAAFLGSVLGLPFFIMGF
jgi:hypothetical protein